MADESGSIFRITGTNLFALSPGKEAEPVTECARFTASETPGAGLGRDVLFRRATTRGTNFGTPFG